MTASSPAPRRENCISQADDKTRRTPDVAAFIRVRLLSPQFGDSVRVVIDTDRIDALAADRTALWDRVSNAAFLTLNEKREAVGYGPVAGGDRWG